MKILHLIPAYLPAVRYGGPIHSVHNLNKELVRQGVDVTVYTTSADGSSNSDVPLGVPVGLDGVKVYYFKPEFPRSWYYSPGLHDALRNTISEFDLVYITSTFLSISLLGSYYAKKFGVPCIISPRGNLMREPLSTSSLKKKLYLFLVENGNLKRANAIHFTSEEESQDYINLGFPKQRHIVVPNSLEVFNNSLVARDEVVVFKNKFGIANNEFVVGYLGRISRIKGFDVLIPAFAEFVAANPEARLLVIGGDDLKGYKKIVVEQIGERGVKDRVVFAGILSGHEKEVAISSVDILVQPSESESFGMAAAEASAHGRPVVLTEGVGLAKLIREYNAGFVIKKNVEELLKAIRALFVNQVLRMEMGENGRRMVRESLSQEKVARVFIMEYDSLIQEYAKKG